MILDNQYVKNLASKVTQSRTNTNAHNHHHHHYHHHHQHHHRHHHHHHHRHHHGCWGANERCIRIWQHQAPHRPPVCAALPHEKGEQVAKGFLLHGIVLPPQKRWTSCKRAPRKVTKRGWGYKRDEILTDNKKSAKDCGSRRRIKSQWIVYLD